MNISVLIRVFSVLAMSFALIACGDSGSGESDTSGSNDSGLSGSGPGADSDADNDEAAGAGGDGGGDSGGDDSAGGGNTTTDASQKANAFAFGDTENKVVDLPLMVGEYAVAIYDAPTTAEIGPGKLQIELSSGSLILTGTAVAGSSGCVDITTPWSTSWDGKDDLIVRTNDGYRLVIDSRNRGDSLPVGGVFISLTDLEGDAVSISNFSAYGSQGETTSNDLGR